MPRKDHLVSSSTEARDLVIAATTALFADKDLSAIESYFAVDYTQHSQIAADGPEGLRVLAGNLPEGFRYEPVRAIADGDLVLTHGIYHGFAEVPLVAFDLFRVSDGKIVEHWDALTPWAETTASGRTQTDGAHEVTVPAETAASKALVAEFAQKVLIGADYSLLTDFISTEAYLQHNPEAGDGLDGFGAAAGAWAEAGKPLVYTKVHQIVAEGEFVFTRSEGTFGVLVSYNDLWRVQDGKIVEHWDVIEEIKQDLPHDNGVF